MLLLKVFITETTRQKLITIYIAISAVSFVMSYFEMTLGLESIEIFHAPLKALERKNEEVLPYLLIIAGLTGMKINFLGIAIVFSQRYVSKRTLGYTRMMSLLNFIKVLVVLLEIATNVLHRRASYQPLKDRTNGFERAMLKYGFDLKYKVAMDETQHVFKCCGNEGIKDWLKIRWQERHFFPNEVIKEVPFSCCNPESEVPCQHYDVLGNLAVFSHEESDLTLYRKGCLESFYNFYARFLTYAVCVPGCFRITLYFCLIPILRYLDTSIYRALKIGFPLNAEFGYLFSCYELESKPAKISLTSQRFLVPLSSMQDSESGSAGLPNPRNGGRRKITGAGE